MHIRIIAVGDRQPPWVDAAVATYAERLPRQWKFRLDRIATSRRSSKAQSARAVHSEGERILAQIQRDERAIVLDEKGMQLTTQQLADRLNDWQTDGRDLCFVIGGPDGIAPACKARADFTWSLSSLTLPHGLARVLCVEQLYRAWSLQSGHPYHRG